METGAGSPMNRKLLHNYFCNLVNQVYKILPMREQESKTLERYIWRLSAEITGGAALCEALGEDSYYMSLLNILQYLKDHCMEDSVEQTKQLVFEGIGLCEKLRNRYVNPAIEEIEPQKAGG
jgi:hypothetical protein